MQDEIILTAYAPALAGDDSRPLAVVRGMEEAFPGLRLEWRLSDEGRPILLEQRDAWVARGREGGKPGLPLLCNGDESHPVTISGWVRPAGVSSGARPLFELHADMPLDASGIAAAADVLEAIAEGARAYWGHASPGGYCGEVAQQTRHSASDPEVSARGLPAIKLPEQIPSPEVPHFFGWLSYWSAAAARAIGFPDPARDADLLSRARRTASGGWVVQLTQAPLDLDDPTHLDALRRAYERFPLVGGRSPPSRKEEEGPGRR